VASLKGKAKIGFHLKQSKPVFIDDYHTSGKIQAGLVGACSRWKNYKDSSRTYLRGRVICSGISWKPSLADRYLMEYHSSLVNCNPWWKQRCYWMNIRTKNPVKKSAAFSIFETSLEVMVTLGVWGYWIDCARLWQNDKGTSLTLCTYNKSNLQKVMSFVSCLSWPLLLYRFVENKRHKTYQGRDLLRDWAGPIS